MESYNITDNMIGASHMAQFGEMLAELRQDRKLTQRELAGILHVSSGTISNYENGTHYPDIDKLNALAAFFQVTTDYLLGRSKVQVSPDLFESALVERYTVGECVRDIIALPPERRAALAVIVSDMKLAAMVQNCGKDLP